MAADPLDDLARTDALSERVGRALEVSRAPFTADPLASPYVIGDDGSVKTRDGIPLVPKREPFRL